MADLPGSADAVEESGASPKSLDNASAFQGSSQADILGEIRLLAEHINRTRRDVAALGADKILKSQVLIATDQLDAIVVHTAEATSTILDVCETLDSSPVLAAHGLVGAATARIYEACSFQDITGQRVGKVVETLQAIESKIAEILHVFGEGSSFSLSGSMTRRLPNVLLNGPQIPGAGMNQGAVDALLDKNA